MLGERLPADQAAAWGLIWRCVPDEALMEEAQALARHFAAAPTRGLARTKQAMWASWTNTLEEQLILEGRMMRELGYSHDYREGVAAFLGKRAPRFTGQ
jgi:2-(1,2-epoxy-1,2-dihydrophenyl)acetyl-CoA isomerase